MPFSVCRLFIVDQFGKQESRKMGIFYQLQLVLAALCMFIGKYICLLLQDPNVPFPGHHHNLNSNSYAMRRNCKARCYEICYIFVRAREEHSFSLNSIAFQRDWDRKGSLSTVRVWELSFYGQVLPPLQTEGNSQKCTAAFGHNWLPKTGGISVGQRMNLMKKQQILVITAVPKSASEMVAPRAAPPQLQRGGWCYLYISFQTSTHLYGTSKPP